MSTGDPAPLLPGGGLPGAGPGLTDGAPDGTVADLVHDLNQPLTALTNFLAAAQITLAGGAAPDALAGLIAAADEQAARARDIVRQMREYLAH